MKKKYFWGMLAIVFVAVLGVGFMSCGDDGDGGNSALSGTWKGQGTGNDDDEKVTIVFRGNNTGTFTITSHDSYYGTETESYTFTYTYEEDTKTGIMIVKFKDNHDSYSSYSSGSSGTETFYFWFEGDKRCLEEHLYGNPEWVLTKQ